LRKKVRALAAFVRRLGQGVRARPLCDVEPVLERAWAARAGLGFVGKNGLVISPGLGSWLLLGEVVTTLELVPDVPIAERCGACTRCLDACPTSAFAEPFVLDPRRCVSYWTIEAAGAPPEELRPALGEHLFGCDVCQEVCPFNAGRAQAGIAPQFAPHERWRGLGLRDVVALGDEGFRQLAEGSPVHRAGRAGLARNALLVAAGRVAAGDGDADARAAIEAGLQHGDAGVREVAVWARERTLRRLGAEAVQPGPPPAASAKPAGGVGEGVGEG
jgi:epoxyqueuosine reductase